MQTTVFTGGTILVHPTPETEGTTSHALAIQGGVVVAIGSEAEALATGHNVEVINLAGGTLAPALGDGHAHPMLGGLESLGPAIRQAADIPGILEAVKNWRAENPAATWIVGGSYDATFAPGGHFDAHWLDEVTGDIPTVLRSWDYHTVWVNSAALAAAGMTAETPDPPLGRIVRREDGSPLGTLQEAAANDFLANIAPSYTVEERIGALERATLAYAAQGTTWIQDAWVEANDLEVYLAAVAQNRLHTRVNLAFRADPARWRAQLHEFVAARETVRNLGADRLNGETVKFFLDGVIESHTAALLEPYADLPEEQGLPNWSREELLAATQAFDTEGFQLHLHAIGDAANRNALDAIEAATLADPDRERHHVIAHVALLDPADVSRFAKLGVIANFEPYWAQCDAVMRDLTIPHLGHPRDSWQYLIGSVQRSGATVSFGSDWPVTTLDWRPALSTAITRHSHENPDAESWLPEERIDAATAFAAYTTGIARQALVQDRGTLEVGMVADAVWLSADPLSVAPEAIADLTIHGTWLAGERTFSPTT
ncbi:amidohydrolase [Leucobacter coleopterorum]|uniref:Amidohydrolase n=1 Tax=Leucobacter coleopterorum TaxID=2714933 RepID=A0ABX6JVA2_9MICO|nr:amidohydrolase [Leucobacter coleopterorum]QIM17926.1 amidohydrolase [Leucobacter coleopterorum]